MFLKNITLCIKQQECLEYRFIKFNNKVKIIIYNYAQSFGLIRKKINMGKWRLF